MNYTVVLERNEEGGYTVTVPALKGCVTEGRTLSEALACAKEAVECHLEALIISGKKIPPDRRIIRLDAEELTEALVFKVSAEPDLSLRSTQARVA